MELHIVMMNLCIKFMFTLRYHDLDDEPSCRPLSCDFENLPLEKETLKSEIVKEIARYHSKHPRPKLTPLATKFFGKSISVNEAAGPVNNNLLGELPFYFLHRFI